MKTELRDTFIRHWERFFPGAELPIAFSLAKSGSDAGSVKPPRDWRCIVCDLACVRSGDSLLFDENSVACSGAKYYMGFTHERRPEFRYFLSCGKPGVMEGERYKRSPEIVDEMDRRAEHIEAQGMCYVFRRWDRLTEEDEPEVAIFFARGEVLSGLFTLANFDQADPDGGVIAPFGSGCSSIIHYPLLEQRKEHPRAVLGMFDPSARPCVPLDTLTFAIPMRRFVQMIGYMEESFLITETWGRVKRKIRQSERMHRVSRSEGEGGSSGSSNRSPAGSLS